MKKIPLTRGYETLVDDEDYEELNRYSWHATVSTRGYIYAHRWGEGRRSILMHRQILGVVSGRQVLIDHLNHDTLDNQKSNLVKSNYVSNGQNRVGASRNSALGVRGVTYRSGPRPYEVWVGHDRRPIYVGRFATLEEASAAAECSRAEIFGLSKGEV